MHVLAEHNVPLSNGMDTWQEFAHSYGM